MVRVEEEHDQPDSRVGRHLVGLASRPWLDARDGSAGRLDSHALEGLELLKHLVLVDLEVGRRQVFDRLAAGGGVGVNTDEVGLGAEDGALCFPGGRRRWLGGRWRCLRTGRGRHRGSRSAGADDTDEEPPWEATDRVVAHGSVPSGEALGWPD